MTLLIQQRTKSDCSVCCLAMHLNVSYEKAIDLLADDYDPEKGVWSIQGALKRAGMQPDDFVEYRRGFEITPEYFLRMAWGRRAFLSIPSLNIERGWHMIYSDGKEIFDPSTKITYVTWDELKPESVILFREGFQ